MTRFAYYFNRKFNNHENACTRKQTNHVVIDHAANYIFVFAQVTVTGNVRDERGDEVIGATVLLIGSQHGVITDVDGNFKLNVPNAKTAVLQISYVGYETQKIALKGKTKISVTLAEVANALNEVMVVAYGTQKKRH